MEYTLTLWNFLQLSPNRVNRTGAGPPCDSLPPPFSLSKAPLSHHRTHFPPPPCHHFSPLSSLLFFTLLTLSLLLATPHVYVHGLKPPFRPKDVLPFLPRSISWPIVSSLYSPIDILPSFVGTVSSPNDSLEWKGSCFYKNRAWMEFHNKSGSEFGGGTLHIKVDEFFVMGVLCLFCLVMI